MAAEGTGLRHLVSRPHMVFAVALISMAMLITLLETPASAHTTYHYFPYHNITRGCVHARDAILMYDAPAQVNVRTYVQYRVQTRATLERWNDRLNMWVYEDSKPWHWIPGGATSLMQFQFSPPPRGQNYRVWVQLWSPTWGLHPWQTLNQCYVGWVIE